MCVVVEPDRVCVQAQRDAEAERIRKEREDALKRGEDSKKVRLVACSCGGDVRHSNKRLRSVSVSSSIWLRKTKNWFVSCLSFRCVCTDRR
jgi:hypothetical protein